MLRRICGKYAKYKSNFTSLRNDYKEDDQKQLRLEKKENAKFVSFFGFWRCVHEQTKR
jgi:hypothetical protein